MKSQLLRIASGSVIFIAAILFRAFAVEALNIETGAGLLKIALFAAAYITLGIDVLLIAARNIISGRVFDENFLMGIATIGAFLIGEYPEGVAVMLFYQIGELFQNYAVNRSRKSIAELMDIRPDYANVKTGDSLIITDPDIVNIGDRIVIKPGERIPLDSVVIEGSSMIDTSALTGESVPRDVGEGSEILSGCININGLLTCEVTKLFSESTVNKILDLVENASNKKSKSENFITKFARYYTPLVVIIALILAFIPPLILQNALLSDWVYRALVFLVVSCPCALVISIPLSFFGGIGGASRKGILVKGSNYLEALAGTEIVVFDKTGTLTKGVFNVREIRSQGMSERELLELTAHAESFSNHPISLSLKQAYGKDIESKRISEFEEIPGHGISAIVDDKKVMAGNVRLMEKFNIPYYNGELPGTVVHITVDGIYAGYIVIADEIKADSIGAIKQLKASGIKKTVMLTGDSAHAGTGTAQELGIDKVYSELLPADKVDKLEELFSQISAKGKLVFVGDGINDAPVLARADIGIAMGGLGSDAAIEAADVVIMTDEPSKIATAMDISKKTLSIARQNIALALIVKAAVLILGAAGMASMWAAVFADVGVAVIAILNALRALH